MLCLQDVRGHVVDFCKDKAGSHFIQSLLEEGAPDQVILTRTSHISQGTTMFDHHLQPDTEATEQARARLDCWSAWRSQQWHETLANVIFESGR